MQASTALVMHPPAPFMDLLPFSLDNGVHVGWVAGHLSRFSTIGGIPVSAYIGEWLSQLFSYSCGHVFSSIVSTGASLLDNLLDLPFCFCEVSLG